MPADPHALIAILDDDPSVRTSLGRLVRSAGYAVKLHATAESILESLQDVTPEAIILDLNMSGLDGFAVGAELTRRGYVIPLVVISANDEALAQARVLFPAAKGFMLKPVESATLLNVVACALSRQ